MKEIEPLRKSSFKSNVLRLQGKDSGFELPLSSHEEVHAGVSADHNDFQNEIRNALLEAESRKAQAVMHLEKHRFTLV